MIRVRVVTPKENAAITSSELLDKLFPRRSSEIREVVAWLFGDLSIPVVIEAGQLYEMYLNANVQTKTWAIKEIKKRLCLAVFRRKDDRRKHYFMFHPEIVKLWDIIFNEEERERKKAFERMREIITRYAEQLDAEFLHIHTPNGIFDSTFRPLWP